MTLRRNQEMQYTGDEVGTAAASIAWHIVEWQTGFYLPRITLCEIMTEKVEWWVGTDTRSTVDCPQVYGLYTTACVPTTDRKFLDTKIA